MIMPRVVYDVAQLIKILQPAEKDIIRLLNDYGYDTRSNMFDLVEAISILATAEKIPFDEFLSRIGGEFYYSDSRQGELFNSDGSAKLTEEGLSKPKQQEVRPELNAFQEKTMEKGILQ